MAIQALTIELPDDLVARLGSPENAAARVKEALVLQLLRDVEISQGEAAELLGLDRRQVLALVAKHRIPSGPETVEEYTRELDVGRRHLQGLRP